MTVPILSASELLRKQLHALFVLPNLHSVISFPIFGYELYCVKKIYMETSSEKHISIIGLGQMGRRIAQLYSEAGFDVTAWNRTTNKDFKLPQVKIAATLEDAIGQNLLTIICVYDNAATGQILKALPDPGILRGRTLVNLTTGSPNEVEALEKFLQQQGGNYLNGAIQVAPDQMGLPETTILMGGEPSSMKKYTADLKVLGGNLRVLGDAAAASSAMDLATLTWLYGSYMGLMYGVKLCQAFGLKLQDFAAIIEEIVPGFTAFFKHEINMISENNYEVTQSPLQISVSATKRIADTFKGLPVAQDFPQIISDILKQADAEHGSKQNELAVLAKVIEKKKQQFSL